MVEVLSIGGIVNQNCNLDCAVAGHICGETHTAPGTKPPKLGGLPGWGPLKARGHIIHESEIYCQRIRLVKNAERIILGFFL